MGIPHYLAMTAAELSAFQPPGYTAWMACHFSPYSAGLSNLPGNLSQGSLLVLDDSTPMEHHNCQDITLQLTEAVETLECAGVLLDFQRPDNPSAKKLAEHLAKQLPCPVGVSSLYAQGLDCPVFLPPAPLHSTLESHLAAWKGREIWLETALDAECLTLTESGCTISPALEIPPEGFGDQRLHCHYQTVLLENAAQFTLWRTAEDLAGLLAEAEVLGVSTAVGLWQEFQSYAL